MSPLLIELGGRGWKLGRAARKCRPAALLAGPAGLLVVLAVLMMPPFPRAWSDADEAQGYRLAGTLAVGKDFIAFLQIPDEGQVLVRTGSVVNGVKVLQVTFREIRLALKSGVVELTLDGTVRKAVSSGTAAVIESSDDARSRVYNRTVSEDQLSRELASQRQGARSPSNADFYAAQRISAVLDLPAGSRVVKVQGRPVASATVAINELQQVLAETGVVVTLDLETPSGHGRVYLMPAKQ